MKKIIYLIIGILTITQLTSCSEPTEEEKKAKIEKLINKANERAEKQDFKGAIKQYDKILKIEPNNIEVLLTRGLLKNITMDTKGALEDATKALMIDKNNSAAYMIKLMAKSSIVTETSSKEASEDLIYEASLIIKTYPETKENEQLLGSAYFSRAIGYLGMDEFKKALSDLNKALRFNKTNQGYIALKQQVENQVKLLDEQLKQIKRKGKS